MSVEETRPRRREAFWTLAVGLPAAFSVLRLWVESGGDLQTTLLLVSNVGTLNLAAALFATTVQLVTAVLVALFAAGGILDAAVRAAPQTSRLRRYPPLVARLATAAPSWLVVAAFALALVTWKILYVPLLVPAAVAVAQREPWRMHDRAPVALSLSLAALAGYLWFVTPAVLDALANREWVIVPLLLLPPLAVWGIAGPVPPWFARGFAIAAQFVLIAATVLAVRSAVQTPVLPQVVAEIDSTDSTDSTDGTGSADGTELLRGHIIAVNDAHVILLQEKGGVRFLPTDDVESTVLCGTPSELPAFVTRIHGYHVEDSLLSATGRQVRPPGRIDPLCGIADLANAR